MFWINFLHLYQPASIDGHVIKEATELSYLRIIRALEEHPKIKFTLNITGCLFLRWEELKYFDLIKQIKKLIKNKQIELTGTAAYHPLLPLISKQEIIQQIKENEAILKKYLYKNFKPKGFFMPEMAYSPEVAKIIKELGYQWLILDEIAYNGKLNQVDFNKIYQDQNSGLKIIFRSRESSKCYVPEALNKIIQKQTLDKEKIFITATDSELYGLRHNDPTAEFEKLIKCQNLKTATISEFIANKKTQKVQLIACNWESTEKELKQNKPYALWFNKKNAIQLKLWELAELACKTIKKYKTDNNYAWARWHLVRGLASCTFWWASANDFCLFDSISWSPDEIERGANELIRSIRTLDHSATRQTKIKAEKLYIKIKQLIWNKHWTYYWKK
ncbi:polysaccharide deacetylase family protein [Patescibacteria group bacterium]|nr:polysaccharide deacetylase family protein [Patescibacteria group bacterium]MBU1349585.1 polysaccharide deacetylase family protein [Patescibacteria group bacterium]MBU1420985.1 polysaccharide deacetylase family protein [Patescibacteria group bacterium]MBU2416180.1 polysaccharide deacetylase family protein [Patescibacteria group bacterium]MBU2456958.1 polysaccharide deacetylase family protein [Patescibacteria group bacterium]